MPGDDGFELGKSAFHGQTTVHPVGLAVLLLLGIAMLLLPRRNAMIAVLACASFIAVGQRVVIFSLDFNFLRLMVLFGWTRVFFRQEFKGFKVKKLDLWFLAYAISATMMYPMSHGINGLVYKLGASFESVGMYFLARMLIRDLADVKSLVTVMAIISLPVACLFLFERQTSRNLFATLGGVPEITMIREGKLRCQGAYAHPILAGCFWAAILPLFIGKIYSSGGGRFLAILGMFASLVIIFTCSSSTPIVGVLAAIIGLCLLPFRRQMRVIHIMFIIMLCCLHCVMEKPVWHLVARTDLIGGSTGWHRFNVIDGFIRHCKEWILFGVSEFTHWGIFMNDITNQYCLEGMRGGGSTLFLFIGMILVAFNNIGRLWRVSEYSRKEMFFAWSIGVSLFVHIINFFGVSYFGQIDMLWYIALALTAVDAVSNQAVAYPEAEIVYIDELQQHTLV